jgi:hypothetical protein
MDDCRFDNWTRMIGKLQDRRAALKDLAGAGVALVALARADLGFAQEKGVLIEGCRLSGDPCSRNSQCCSDICKGRKRKQRNGKGENGNRRRNRDTGTCECRGSGKNCRQDAACCEGRCDPNEGVCRCVGANGACNVDNDCCGSRICQTDNRGNKFCKGGNGGKRNRRDKND